MSRALKGLALFGSLAALAACSALIGTRDLTLVDEDGGAPGGGGDGSADGTVTPPGHDGGTDAPGSETSTTNDGALPDGDAACSGDLANDQHNCGRCGHDCLGGACTLGVCQSVTIVQGQPGAVSIAVDATSIYWAGNYNDQILKADKDGKNITILAHDAPGNAAAPYGIALDGAYVYWATNTSYGSVARCAKTGCLGVGTRINKDDLDVPRAVAVDGTTVFWADNDVYGGIGRMHDDGGAFGFLVTEERNMFNLAIDDASVFFVSQVNVGRIARTAPVVDSGSVDAATGFATIFSGGLYATGVALDGTTVYWAENNDLGAIRSAPKAGVGDAGVPNSISESEHNPWHIVVDDTNVYWTATGPDTSTDNTVTLYVDGYVATCPKTGCGSHPPMILASGLHNVRGIALDDTAVYATYYGNESAQQTVSEGGIVKIAKP